MDSNEIKSALYNHYRFKKQAHIMADEVSTSWSLADFLVIDRADIVTEIEIKTSLSDLKADFKKDKYFILRNNKTADLFPRHYFYFCVPVELKDKALIILQEQDSRIGLLYADKAKSKFIFKEYYIYTEKRAKLLIKDIDQRLINSLKDKVTARLSSAMAFMMREKYDISKKD